jgi:hypothetical protein
MMASWDHPDMDGVLCMSLPSLRLDASWQPTRDALHAYARVLGGIRQALTPKQRHWAHACLFVSAEGLTTSPIPLGARDAFELIMALRDPYVGVIRSSGERQRIPLSGQSATELYDAIQRLIAPLAGRLELAPELLGTQVHALDPEAVARFGEALTQTDLVFKRFAGELRRGATSVQFWPHNFDLAVMWLSGRAVPGVDEDDEDNGDERMNFGLSTGDASIPEPYYYATAYPLPAELPMTDLPPGARWHTTGWQGAVLPYEALMDTEDPSGRLLEFLKYTQAAGRRLMTPAGYD